LSLRTEENEEGKNGEKTWQEEYAFFYAQKLKYSYYNKIKFKNILN